MTAIRIAHGFRPSETQRQYADLLLSPAGPSAREELAEMVGVTPATVEGWHRLPEFRSWLVAHLEDMGEVSVPVVWKEVLALAQSRIVDAKVRLEALKLLASRFDPGWRSAAPRINVQRAVFTEAIPAGARIPESATPEPRAPGRASSA